jgi:serine protease Do
LVDTAGKVVGINIIPGQLQGGMGLAIPIDDAKNLLAMLKQGNIPRRPWLGISVQYVTDKLARSFGLPDSMGALVSRVLPDSPGASAGIERGDIIITFAGRPVEDPQALIEAVRASATNRHVEMNVFRKGKRKKIQITPRETP